jgi:transposase
MKALSADLRERICDAIAHDALATYPDIAARFAVSLASVERLARKRREGRSLVPGVSTGRIPKVGPEQRAAFEQLAASRTKWTLRSLADAWQEQTGVTLSLTTVSRLLKQCDFTYKKRARRL